MRHRNWKRRISVQMIREVGRGEGFQPPRADKRDPIRVGGRAFRRAQRGLFKS